MSTRAESSERVVKRSVSLPRSLLDAVEERAGERSVSAVVTEAVDQWVAMAKLREVIAADAEHGPVDAEAREWAERAWRESA